MRQAEEIRISELNIGLMIREIIQNLVFIVLAALTAVIGVRLFLDTIYVPNYTANATLAVSVMNNSGGSAYTSLPTANSMASVFSDIFQSQVMTEKVAESIGRMPKDVEITSNVVSGTNLLELEVTAANPEEAYNVIEALLDNYYSVSDYLFGNAVVEVVQKPAVPVEISNPPDTIRYECIAAALGAAVVIGMCVLLYVMKDSIKTVNGAQRTLEGNRLGTIGHEEKNRTIHAKLHNANRGLLLTNPNVSFGFEESYHRLTSKIMYQMFRNKSKVILITSAAENEGKSTVAANLAYAMAMSDQSKKILLVDMDFLKPALYKLLDIPDSRNVTVSDCLRRPVDMKEILVSDKQKNLYYMLNYKHIYNSRKVLKSDGMKQFMDHMREQMDYIIMDSAPAMAGADAEMLGEYADETILVVRQDYVCTTDLNDTAEMLDHGEGKYMGYVLNNFYDRTRRAGYGRYGAYSGYHSQESAHD